MPAAELGHVPFFPQSRYQCGPAALATVLVSSGVDITPEALVPEVYLPERRGSLQVELVAAARRHGRLPYPLEPQLEALLREVAAGSPILVLQNLGLPWLPRWHYAVVVGYEAERRRVLLRSGREQRRREPVERFLRSWSLAGRWSIRVLRPGEVPVSGSPGVYLQTLLDAEAALPAEAVGRVLDAGLTAWPDDADLAFAAGNLARQAGDVDRAQDLYRRTLGLDPDHVGALNNYADLLLAAGCPARAREVIGRALRLVEPESPLRAVVHATHLESMRSDPGRGTECRFDESPRGADEH